MTLIHTAFQSEAQSIIELFNLKLFQANNQKIYMNDNIILIISGMGEENTTNALAWIFDNYDIHKAINIGIAGCSNKSIDIGELFCTNRYLKNIKYMNLETVNNPKIFTNILSDTLYDMEARYFLDISLKFLDEKDIYIFKVVSDYLDDTIPNKEFVKQLIRNNLKSIKEWI